MTVYVTLNCYMYIGPTVLILCPLNSQPYFYVVLKSCTLAQLNSFFTADIQLFIGEKSTGVTNHINDGYVVLKSP